MEGGGAEVGEGGAGAGAGGGFVAGEVGEVGVLVEDKDEAVGEV